MNKSIQRQRLQASFQEEILSNYYRSRYETYMQKFNKNKTNDNKQKERKILSPKKQSPVKKISKGPLKNFKHLILQKKYSTEKKNNNFKQILIKKNQQVNNVNEAVRSFKQISPAIYQQLNNLFPTPIQTGNYNSIDIVSKIINQPQRKLVYDQEQPNNIQIKEENSQIEHQINIYQESLKDEEIKQAIRGSFIKKSQRSPTKRSNSNKLSNKDQSLNKNKLNYHSKGIDDKQDDNYQLSLKDKYNSGKNISNIGKNNYESIPSRLNNKKQKQVKQQQKSLKKYNLQESNNSRYVREQLQDNAYLPHDVSQRQSYEQSKLIHFQLPEQQFGNTQYNLFFLPIHQNISSNNPEPIHHEVEHHSQRLSDYIPTELRQQLGDMSMISRFSMTSEEGAHIKHILYQELSESQYGPYQDALEDLRNLIEKYPNSRRIYLVGQRMMDDRKQYQVKQQNQKCKISQIQTKIVKLKQKIKKIPKQNTNKRIYENSKRILQLVRKLSKNI